MFNFKILKSCFKTVKSLKKLLKICETKEFREKIKLQIKNNNKKNVWKDKGFFLQNVWAMIKDF